MLLSHKSHTRYRYTVYHHMQRVTVSASRKKSFAFSCVLIYPDLVVLLGTTLRPTRSTWLCFTLRLLRCPFRWAVAVKKPRHVCCGCTCEGDYCSLPVRFAREAWHTPCSWERSQGGTHTVKQRRLSLSGIILYSLSCSMWNITRR